jgi:hypothetical protein
MNSRILPIAPTARRASLAARRVLLLSASVATVLAYSADAHVPRPNAVARHELTLLDAGATSPSSEQRRRHEPSMLDKLAGATLVNSAERATVVGVVVLGVSPWSAMWRNGLRPSDVIIAVERDRVRSLDDLERALGRVTWGFALEVVRHTQRVQIFVP